MIPMPPCLQIVFQLAKSANGSPPVKKNSLASAISLGSLNRPFLPMTLAPRDSSRIASSEVVEVSSCNGDMTESSRTGQALAECPATERHHSLTMPYVTIQQPFTLKFREMSKQDLKDYFRWFFEVLPTRIRELTNAVSAIEPSDAYGAYIIEFEDGLHFRYERHEFEPIVARSASFYERAVGKLCGFIRLFVDRPA